MAWQSAAQPRPGVSLFGFAFFSFAHLRRRLLSGVAAPPCVLSVCLPGCLSASPSFYRHPLSRKREGWDNQARNHCQPQHRSQLTHSQLPASGVAVSSPGRRRVCRSREAACCPLHHPSITRSRASGKNRGQGRGLFTGFSDSFSFPFRLVVQLCSFPPACSALATRPSTVRNGRSSVGFVRSN